MPETGSWRVRAKPRIRLPKAPVQVDVAAVNHGGHQSIVAAASLPPPDLRCTALLSNSGPELHSEEDPGKCSSHLATSAQSKTPQFHNVE